MILVWLSFLVLALDRVTKMAVASKMAEGESIPVIENIFHLTYVLNPGAAFGMLPHNRTFFLVIGTAAVLAILWMRKEILAEGWRVRTGMALFLGGALGNLWDRVQTGLVIDFFDFRVWPVFNVADIAICAGVGLILWDMIQNKAWEN
ncbi:MAG: signal peptidase II [Acidaminococcaceae bacterium]|nr:signal peptidase II [Acidaminococcaceae bacterium]MBQ9635574.1 signal peptidase II [Acidaminococcaceae bacterium]